MKIGKEKQKNRIGKYKNARCKNIENAKIQNANKKELSAIFKRK